MEGPLPYHPDGPVERQVTARHSRTGHFLVVLQPPLRSKPIAGRIHIVVTSSGRPVYIDGIGTSLT